AARRPITQLPATPVARVPNRRTFGRDRATHATRRRKPRHQQPDRRGRLRRILAPLTSATARARVLTPPLPLLFLAEHESAFRGVDGTLRTGVRIAQDSLRSTRMRLDSGVSVRCSLPQNGFDHFFAKGDEGAAQTELHIPVAATELHSEFLSQFFLLPVR